jgi:hypothetical protein
MFKPTINTKSFNNKGMHQVMGMMNNMTEAQKNGSM